MREASVRISKDSHVAEGVPARIGREIVVFGAQFDRWMREQAHRVRDFDCTPNNPEHAYKRGGGIVARFKKGLGALDSLSDIYSWKTRRVHSSSCANGP